MIRHRNRLYSLLITACLAGYIWLYYNINANVAANHAATVCIIKHTTNLPCPSCGTTRAVVSLTKGNLAEAFNYNPFGYLIALVLLVAPLWIAVDTVRKSHSLFHVYQRLETILRKPSVAIPLVLLVIINWVWNITKGL